MNNVDVAIIGAGPAGSATAIGLARRGYEVALIDKKLFPRDKLCGDFVNPINWAVFSELGVEDRVLAQPRAEVTGFRITTAAGSNAAAQFSSSIGLGLRRAYLDQVLLDRAAALGVTIFQGRRLADLSRAGQTWRLKTDDGKEWQAKILVGADGRNSWVAQRLGLNKRAAEGGSVGFQCRLKYAGAVDGQVEIHLFPGGYAGVVGLGDGTLNLCLAVDKRTLPRQRSAAFVFARILPRNPFLRDLLQRSESMSEIRSVYPVYFSERRCYADAVLLAGDAARVSEPVTGEGIYFAMRSGLLAAQAADRALRRGDLTAAGLKNYRQSCRLAFRGRLTLNRILRFAMYRRALLDPFIWLSAKHNRMLDSLVNAVCAP
jgi:menaquinone-9 beta-reductase